MRGAPPVEVRVRRQGPWRAFIVTLVALTAGSVGVWLASAEAGAALRAALGLATVIACSAALSTTKPFDVNLRWTGLAWALSRNSAPMSDPLVGTLTAAIDLGSWMLLRFVDEAPGARTTWLPVQRSGLDGDWHALRCAVHAPRRLPRAP
jgi:hypothetical protein